MKYIYTFLSCVLILLLAGSCQEKNKYRIGISQCSSDDWRYKMNEEVLREALLHKDVEVEIRSANGDSQQQIADLEYFANNKFDVIVVAPNEAESLTPEVKKLYDEGFPIIIFDRNIYGDTYTQRIGVDNIGLGSLAARYAHSLIPQGLRVLEIYGLPGSTPAIDRSEGFQQVVDSVGGVILGVGAGDWEQDKAEGVADSLLELYPEVNLIFAHNDRMALGVRKALEKIGKENEVKIIGIDASPKIGLKGVSEGKIDATFLYPSEGHLVLREAIKLAKGEDVDREIMLPMTSAVDKTNVDILILQNENLEEDTQKVFALKNQLDNYVSLHNAQTALVYAIIAILILLFGVLFLVLRTFWAHRRHQAALLHQNRLLQEERDKQKELNEKLEEATQSKISFFTNVSHDLRTPLTLIAEPVEQLNSANNLNTQQKTFLRIAEKNVKILQRLIDQILDFRQFEINKLKLSLTEVDFNKVIRDWLESFYALARKRDIKLVLNEPDEPIKIAIDAEKIERVFFNLISNAIKYSADNSTITVSFAQKDKNLILKVADTGEGISREDLPHIFDHFFRVEKVRAKGSGIGLVLAKAFVELHGGTITVESELKKGTTFTVTIPVTHVAEQTEDVHKNISQQDVAAELETVETVKSFEEEKPLLLVIDDNKDIRELVSELMREEYNVVTAPDGKEGIRKAIKYVPDLIVCDVMMPGMDGMECCTRLKSETITSHIPVLMLTACSLDEQRVQGFESGADGYLSKPFSSAVLKAQAHSLIANRKRIKEVLGTNTPQGKTLNASENEPSKQKPAVQGDIDNEFYNRFISLFDKKMGDPDLNVEAMASELGFERTQLYRKIKAITNYSPVELMRNIRLKKARHILKTTEKTISEVCYEVGFSNPAYFTKCYREQYGETPSETRLNH